MQDISQRLNELNTNYPISISYMDKINDHLNSNQHLLQEKNGLELALLSVLASEQTQQPKQMSGGVLCVAPTTKPNSIKDAGKDALAYLRATNKI